MTCRVLFSQEFDSSEVLIWLQSKLYSTKLHKKTCKYNYPCSRMDLTQQIMHGMNILKMFNIIDDISNHEN